MGRPLLLMTFAVVAIGVAAYELGMPALAFVIVSCWSVAVADNDRGE